MIRSANNSKFSIRHWLLLLLSVALTFSCVSSPVAVLVDGKRKIGAFNLAFQDLALPLAGLPIEITRSYDSRDRMKAGDFGYGWTLGVNAVTLRKNRPLGEDWYQSIQEFSVMGAEMYLYSLEPDVAPGGTVPVKHLVTINFPDDTMATFVLRIYLTS